MEVLGTRSVVFMDVGLYGGYGVKERGLWRLWGVVWSPNRLFSQKQHRGGAVGLGVRDKTLKCASFEVLEDHIVT